MKGNWVLMGEGRMGRKSCDAICVEWLCNGSMSIGGLGSLRAEESSRLLLLRMLISDIESCGCSARSEGRTL